MGQQGTKSSSLAQIPTKEKKICLRDYQFIKSIATPTNETRWKLNDDENSHFYSKKADYIRKNRQSILEEQLPFEIMFEILLYLLPEDLISLSLTSRNFRFVWTEHPFLWYSIEDDNSKSRRFINKTDVEHLLNDLKCSVTHWKQVYSTSISFLRYPIDFSYFVDNCVSWNRIYGEWNGIRKIGFVGPKGSGKSTYCKFLYQNFFDENMKPTIGCDFYVQYLNLKYEENGRTMATCFKLEIWDISYLFESMYRGLATIYFCFDLSNEESLFQMMDSLKQYCNLDLGISDLDTCSNIKEVLKESRRDIVFIGMKKECKTISNSTISRVLSRFIDTQQVYKERHVGYFEVSSKQPDKTTLYPVAFIAKSPSTLEEHRFNFRLTLLTKENEEYFRDYGVLD